MSRYIALLALLIMLLLPTTAYAESASWTADPPKQVGLPVIWCTATATAGGDTYTMRNYAPLDEGFDAERYARRVFTEDVKRAMLFRFKESHVIQDSDVRISCG
jgi:hypothetical protein